MRIGPFSTERLLVRDWRDDVENPLSRRELETDLGRVLTPPVLEHLPPPLQVAVGQGGISAWIDARAAESDVFLVTERDGGALLGLLILALEDESEPTVHIGYLLAEAAWGRGLASELVTGLVAALAPLGPIIAIGGVDKSNPASARVLQKAGFEIDPDLSDPDVAMYVRQF